MPKFQKKPVVIEAVQYDGTPECARRIGLEITVTETGIQTLEGFMRASPGDWIITGVKGERYPCKPDIFDATYGPVSPDPTPDLARVTKERDDFAKGAFNLADEAEQSKDCGESQGENCCGECIACRDVTLADTASKLAAAREREQELVALLREAREEVDRGWRFRDGRPGAWRPLFVRELLAKIDTALAAAGVR